MYHGGIPKKQEEDPTVPILRSRTGEVNFHHRPKENFSDLKPIG